MWTSCTWILKGWFLVIFVFKIHIYVFMNIFRKKRYMIKHFFVVVTYCGFHSWLHLGRLSETLNVLVPERWRMFASMPCLLIFALKSGQYFRIFNISKYSIFPNNTCSHLKYAIFANTYLKAGNCRYCYLLIVSSLKYIPLLLNKCESFCLHSFGAIYQYHNLQIRLIFKQKSL